MDAAAAAVFTASLDQLAPAALVFKSPTALSLQPLPPPPPRPNQLKYSAGKRLLLLPHENMNTLWMSEAAIAEERFKEKKKKKRGEENILINFHNRLLHSNLDPAFFFALLIEIVFSSSSSSSSSFDGAMALFFPYSYRFTCTLYSLLVAFSNVELTSPPPSLLLLG